MTKRERDKIIKAIEYFLNEDPTKWILGIDELYLLIYGERWSKHMTAGKPVSIRDIMRREQQ